jgi:hypothetical protein
MIRYLTLSITLYSIYMVENFQSRLIGQDTLQIKLNQFNQMQKGKNTSFDDVEKLGKELLGEYTKPEDQGRIYFRLVEIHGQTGMSHPDLVIRYAQTALGLPLDPLQRSRMYVFWGGAIEIGNVHKSVEEREPIYKIRRLAVKPYLEGLKEMQIYEIPEKMPELPSVSNIVINDVSENDPDYQEFKKTQDAQIAARAEAQFDRKLWFSHQTLMNGVIDLYARPPFAATELRQLATKILNNPEQVNALMKRIEDKGALKDDPIPEKAKSKATNK